jgi:FkbM family methyltransferase
MTFISYAQNSEDVLLWRALGHVRDGFYIDVGASDPVEHSVTKAFYDAGWHGINIEPLPAHAAAFAEQRPRDLNLAIAAGSQPGELTLYDVPAVRGWASPKQSVAESHRAEGHEVAELKVPVRPLAAVCEEHVRGEIHFLKIDVEGFEGEVLQGMDFGRWRPWVLVIEATLPGSRETSHDTWEHLVTGQRYRFAWFDGLNRYYVAEEHAELLDAFKVQPNVFDAFISWHLDRAWNNLERVDGELRDTAQRLEQQVRLSAQETARAEQEAARADSETARAAQLAAELRAAGAEVEALNASLAELEDKRQKLSDWAGGLERRVLASEAWAQDLEQRLIATHRSTSWKVTRPLRLVGSVVHALRRPHLARRIVTRLTANERLRRLLIPALLRHPKLNQRVASSIAAIKLDPPQQAPAGVEVPEHLRGLPVSVRTVLADLQRARSKQGH